jgi:hypothetical protein
LVVSSTETRNFLPPMLKIFLDRNWVERWFCGAQNGRNLEGHDCIILYICDYMCIYVIITFLFLSEFGWYSLFCFKEVLNSRLMFDILHPKSRQAWAV